MELQLSKIRRRDIASHFPVHGESDDHPVKHVDCVPCFVPWWHQGRRSYWVAIETLYWTWSRRNQGFHSCSFDHLRVCTKQASSTKFPLRYKRHRLEYLMLLRTCCLKVVQGVFLNHGLESKLAFSWLSGPNFIFFSFYCSTYWHKLIKPLPEYEKAEKSRY